MYHYSSGKLFKRITAVMMQSLQETAKGISPIVFRNRLAPTGVQSSPVMTGFIWISLTPAALSLGLLWRRTRDSRKPSGQDLPVSRPLPAGRDTGQPRARWHKAAVSTAPPTPPHPRTSTAPRRAMTSGTNAETWSCLPRGVAQTRPVRVPAPQGCSCASAQTGIST